MRKPIWSGVAGAVAVVCFSTPVFAQVAVPGSITVTASVSARAKLTLTGAVDFADADPDAFPSITATAPLAVEVRARTGANAGVTLTLQAAGDLESLPDTIGIGNLSWTSGGSGFVDGTASSVSAVAVGGWTGGGSPSGTQTFALVNSWAYATGNYSVVLNYTLTVP
jgi:hypothetical protein